MVRTLKHSLFLASGLAASASAAMYVLGYFLFTVHEEIGLPAGAALAPAIWTFPIVFLGSLVYYSVRKAPPGRR
jgi:hypothetical protein